METHGGNSATRATDLANGCRHLGHPGDVLGLHHRAESPYWPGHRAGQHVDVRLTAEDGYTAERECSIASAPGEPLATTVERWWGLEATAYLYIAFVAVLFTPDAHRLTSAPTTAIRDLRDRERAPRATSRPRQPSHTDERS